MNKKIIALVIAVLVVSGFIGYEIGSSTVKVQRYGGTANLTALTLSAGIVTGGVNATTSATSTGSVLQQADFYLPTGELASGIAYSALASSTGQGQTLTLGASSSFTTLVPNAGDTYGVWLYNASTTGTTTILAGGTGTTLLNSTTTKTIQPGGAAWLVFQRLSNTSINVFMSIFK